MTNRSKLDVVKDILEIVRDNHNSIKKTPLLRKANLSTKRFNEYYTILFQRELIKELILKESVYVTLTDKGFNFLEKYSLIKDFFDEFEI
jgi:predicted transcriptional regulator